MLWRHFPQHAPPLGYSMPMSGEVAWGGLRWPLCGVTCSWTINNKPLAWKILGILQLPGLRSPLALTDASCILGYPPRSLLSLSPGVSGIFCAANLVLVEWQSPGTCIFFFLCLQLPWHYGYTALCVLKCHAIDYTAETGTGADRWLLFSHKVRAPCLRTFVFRTSELRRSTQILIL